MPKVKTVITSKYPECMLLCLFPCIFVFNTCVHTFVWTMNLAFAILPTQIHRMGNTPQPALESYVHSKRKSDHEVAKYGISKKSAKAQRRWHCLHNHRGQHIVLNRIIWFMVRTSFLLLDIKVLTSVWTFKFAFAVFIPWFKSVNAIVDS